MTQDEVGGGLCSCMAVCDKTVGATRVAENGPVLGKADACCGLRDCGLRRTAVVICTDPLALVQASRTRVCCRPWWSSFAVMAVGSVVLACLLQTLCLQAAAFTDGFASHQQQIARRSLHQAVATTSTSGSAYASASASAGTTRVCW